MIYNMTIFGKKFFSHLRPTQKQGISLNSIWRLNDHELENELFQSLLRFPKSYLKSNFVHILVHTGLNSSPTVSWCFKFNSFNLELAEAIEILKAAAQTILQCLAYYLILTFVLLLNMFAQSCIYQISIKNILTKFLTLSRCFANFDLRINVSLFCPHHFAHGGCYKYHLITLITFSTTHSSKKILEVSQQYGSYKNLHNL